MTRATRALMLSAVAVFVIALGIGLVAFCQLDEVGRSSFFGDVARLSYQAMAIVVLGALLTKALADARDDRMRAQTKADVEAARAAQLIERRSEYIRRLVSCRHSVDTARMFIRAHRSVTSWTKQMDRIVTSYVELRDVRHDLATAYEAGDPLFEEWPDIGSSTVEMVKYLERLIDEFGDRKKNLEEVQIQAEQDRTRQAEVWEALQDLPCLGDLLEDGDNFDVQFVRPYHNVLRQMRSELAKPG